MPMIRHEILGGQKGSTENKCGIRDTRVAAVIQGRGQRRSWISRDENRSHGISSSVPAWEFSLTANLRGWLLSQHSLNGPPEGQWLNGGPKREQRGSDDGGHCSGGHQAGTGRRSLVSSLWERDPEGGRGQTRALGSLCGREGSPQNTYLHREQSPCPLRGPSASSDHLPKTHASFCHL